MACAVCGVPGHNVQTCSAARPWPNAFGRLLRRLRQDARVSARELARRMGVTHAWLCGIERGLHCPPSRARVEQVARELKVPNPAAMVDAARRDIEERAGLLWLRGAAGRKAQRVRVTKSSPPR